MTALSGATLPAITIPSPSYDRDAVTASVVHLGAGNFHRSHQAVYLDRVLAAGDPAWGICGVGLLPGDAATASALRAQDGLYTLVTVDPDGTESARVIGSLVDCLFAPDDPDAVLAKMADPSTRIVSCDDIQSNGTVTRTAVTGLATALDADLGRWIEDTVHFPSSMVDRITPSSTETTRELVRERFGVEDASPVRSETSLQWVLEDDFGMGRPGLEAVGVQGVADVIPYELMKLRLLNASHQVMSYPGLLAGLEWVHEVCRDPAIAGYLRRYMAREARPTLAPVPGVDLDAYCEALMARFSSAAVGDTLQRQVFDGSERIAKFVVPVVRDQLLAGGEIDCSVTTLAAWGLFVEGELAGGPGHLRDRRAAELAAVMEADRTSPGALLEFAPVFGDLGSSQRLRDAYRQARESLIKEGPTQVILALGDGQ